MFVLCLGCAPCLSVGEGVDTGEVFGQVVSVRINVRSWFRCMKKIGYG